MKNIEIKNPHLGPNSFASIDAAVREAAKSQQPLIIDMTAVRTVNGDFFNDLIAAYMATYQETYQGSRLDAIKAMQQHITLRLVRDDPVYKASKAGHPVFRYDFTKRAA